MKVELEVDGNGFIIPKKTSLKKGIYIAEVKYQDLRTIAQNSSLHLYLTMLTTELNNAGYTFSTVIKDEKPCVDNSGRKLYDMEIDWSPHLGKEYLWRPIQKSIFNKKSTTQLEKEDITKVYDNLNRYTSGRMGISVPFPTYGIKYKK